MRQVEEHVLELEDTLGLLSSFRHIDGLPVPAVAKRISSGLAPLSRLVGRDPSFAVLRAGRQRRRYDPLVRGKLQLTLDTTLLKPGMRVAVGLSGGADSVALLCALHERKSELGLVLHAAHLHHGLRGEEADGDLEFCRALAGALGIPFDPGRVDVAAEASAKSQTLEEAAHHLRSAWFRELLAGGEVDAVATAHTRDDQAETVLAKLLRGAWTEGLSGIHPVLEFPEGRVIRPLLATSRAEIEAYLKALGQEWREDSSNRSPAHTRNRIRHELLPLLEGWNPRLRAHLAGMAALARDEEAWWQAEIAKLAPQLLLAGRPVRGGGRAGADSAQGVAIDVTRLAALPPAIQRRLLRHAALSLGAAPDFEATEALRAMALAGRAGQKLELEYGLRAERTARELRMEAAAPAAVRRNPASGQEAPAGELTPQYVVPIPGEVAAEAFGIRLRIETDQLPAAGSAAKLRSWRPGDRIRLRYSSAPKKVKEVLERMRVTGSSRSVWPVLELAGRIVWMQGVEAEPEPGICIVAEPLSSPARQS